MCDYSLHLIASRPAKVADRLVSTDFVKSITRGFTEIGQPDVAVCAFAPTANTAKMQHSAARKNTFTLAALTCLVSRSV